MKTVQRKFTLAKAKSLAVKLIGTSKEIKRENPYCYIVPLSDVRFNIQYDPCCDAISFTISHDGHSITSYYNFDTLEYDYDLTEINNNKSRKALVEMAAYDANSRWKEKLQGIMNGDYPDAY